MSVPVNDPKWVEPEAEVCAHTHSQLDHTKQVRLADEGVYCICRERDDGTFMILCEFCNDWFHGRCIGIRERDGPFVDVYVCPNCAKAGKGNLSSYFSHILGVTRWKGGINRQIPTGPPGLGTSAGGVKRPLSASGSSTESDPKRQRVMTEEERAAVQEQRKRQQEAVQRRQREEMAARRKKEMEEKKRAAEERERLQQQRLRQSREHIDSKRAQNVSVLEKVLRTGLDQDLKNGHVTTEVIKTTYKDPSVVAKEIETALFALHKDLSKEYSAFFRSLIFNVKDEKNTSLRERIFKGELLPGDLVQMDSKDLANTEIMRYRQEKEKELFAEVYKRPETEIVIRKTHKGIELDDETVMDLLESAAAELTSRYNDEEEREKEPTQQEGLGENEERETVLVGLSTPPATPKRLSISGTGSGVPLRGSKDGADSVLSTPKGSLSVSGEGMQIISSLRLIFQVYQGLLPPSNPWWTCPKWISNLTFLATKNPWSTS